MAEIGFRLPPLLWHGQLHRLCAVALSLATIGLLGVFGWKQLNKRSLPSKEPDGHQQVALGYGQTARDCGGCAHSAALPCGTDASPTVTPVADMFAVSRSCCDEDSCIRKELNDIVDPEAPIVQRIHVAACEVARICGSLNRQELNLCASRLFDLTPECDLTEARAPAERSKIATWFFSLAAQHSSESIVPRGKHAGLRVHYNETP